ncbi:MAG: aminoacyl-histidine dipeptidase [Gammaproteobacteria bacterium]|nr:aminoacyl-histidine dipeptidase [Gammaproteobacteria bacterium]
MGTKTIMSLEPTLLWEYFSVICQIPHVTGDEEQLAKHIESFAKDLNLEVLRDEVNNIVIKKPATPGLEDCKTVILQAHLDMVGEKSARSSHNFQQDPIEMVCDGDWVRANETTLGADNGIGVAAAMAILASTDIEHGPLEVLFTTDEEQNYTGAYAVKAGMLSGEIMLNLDIEDDELLIIGSAGGVNTLIEFPHTTIKPSENTRAYQILVDGLKGGHSGVDIHAGLGNANKILAQILWQATNRFDMALSLIDGGNMFTAIPRTAFANVVVSDARHAEFLHYCITVAKEFQNEFVETDPELTITVNAIAMPETIFDPELQYNMLAAIVGCPNGVISVSEEIPGLVESSSNLACIKTGSEIDIITSQRSSVDSWRDAAKKMVASVFRLAGGKVTHEHSYPGWTPNPSSKTVQLIGNVYERLFDSKITVTAIHAGLECGLFLQEYPHLDIVSFGPTIKDPHSPNERVSISSVAKFWQLLVAVLADIPRK